MSDINKAYSAIWEVSKLNELVGGLRGMNDNEICKELDNINKRLLKMSNNDLSLVINTFQKIEFLIEQGLSSHQYACFIDWRNETYPDFTTTIFENELSEFLSNRESEINKWCIKLRDTHSDLEHHLTLKIQELKESLKQEIKEIEYINGSSYWMRLIHVKEKEIYESLLSEYKVNDDADENEPTPLDFDLDSISEKVLLLHKLGFYDNLKTKYPRTTQSANFLADITSKIIGANKGTIQKCLNPLINNHVDDKNHPKQSDKIDLILRKLNPE